VLFQDVIELVQFLIAGAKVLLFLELTRDLAVFFQKSYL